MNASRSAVVLDAHAQAAALLSGSRIVTKDSRIGETAETLGQHPAVLVAQKWSTGGIDPNTFIVAHPARLQLLTAADEIPAELRPRDDALQASASTPADGIQGVGTTDFESGPGSHPETSEDVH